MSTLLTQPRSKLEALLRGHRLPLAALAIYLVCRAISALVLLLVAHRQEPLGVPGGPDVGSHVSYWDVTRMWDGEWYRRIAEHGYPSSVPRDDEGHAAQSELAFYPLWPLLVRALMTVTGGGFAVSASVLALCLGCAAVVVMTRLLAPRLGVAVTLAAVVVYASSPPSPVLQMAYTESLAMLLLCAMLLLLERRAWWFVAALAVLIGFARPIGVPLAVVGAVAAWLRWRERRTSPIAAREGLGMTAALAGCGVSGALWPVTAWMLTGERDAYTETMGAWRPSHVVTPFEAWWRIGDVLFVRPFGPIVVALVLLTIALLVAGPWSARLGPVLLAWCGAYAFYLFASLEPWSSTLRYLLMFFPLAASLVGGAWRRGPSRAIPVLMMVLFAANLAGQVWWALHFVLFTPPLGNPP